MTRIHNTSCGIGVVPLLKRHLPQVLALMNNEGWYYYDKRELERYLDLDQACFVLEKDQAVMGSLFTTHYGNQAWIGNIVVAKAERGKGFASRLISHAMDLLNTREGIKTFRLGSVPLAINLYKKAGFRAEAFVSAQEADLPLKRIQGADLQKGLTIDRMKTGDLPAIAKMDERFFKSPRLPLLTRLFHDALKPACLCLRDGGKILGFLMIRKRKASRSEGGFDQGPDHAYRLGPSCVLPEYGITGFKALLHRAIPLVNADAEKLGGTGKIYTVFPKTPDKKAVYRETRELAEAMGLGDKISLDRIFDHHHTIFNRPGSEKTRAQEKLMGELGFHQEYFEQIMSCEPGPEKTRTGSPEETRADPRGIFAAATPGDKA